MPVYLYLSVCPECAYEWSEEAEDIVSDDVELVIKDANGQRLVDGDTVTVIKDLKIKGFLQW